MQIYRNFQNTKALYPMLKMLNCILEIKSKREVFV